MPSLFLRASCNAAYLPLARRAAEASNSRDSRFTPVPGDNTGRTGKKPEAQPAPPASATASTPRAIICVPCLLFGLNSSKEATATRYSNSPVRTAVAGAVVDKREFDVEEFVLSTDSFYAPMARLKSARVVVVSRRPWSREAVWELTRQGEGLLSQFGTADRAAADAASDGQRAATNRDAESRNSSIVITGKNTW
jgi:hypothetical protein